MELHDPPSVPKEQLEKQTTHEKTGKLFLNNALARQQAAVEFDEVHRIVPDYQRIGARTWL